MTHPQNKKDDQAFTVIKGISDISTKYDGYIFDIYGVIHNGIELFDGTIDCLTQLKNQNKRICLLSNTPKLRDAIREDLRSIGLEPNLYDGIVTAGDSARDAAEDYRGQPCWFAGKDVYFPIIDGLNCMPLDNTTNAEFVLNAISGLYPMEHDSIVTELKTALAKQLPMICANPDHVVMIGDEQHVCAGTYAQLYEDMGGKVSYHGKPHTPVYNDAQKILGITDKSKIVSVGDSLHTDIQGANKFGIDCVFNVDGIHYNEISCSKSANRVDFSKLSAIVKEQGYYPTYALNGFAWTH